MERAGGELTVSDGVISQRQQTHASRYGKVAAAAAKLHAARCQNHHAQGPEDWKIAGKPLKRLDTADKLNGSKVYAIDVKLPECCARRSRIARCSAARSSFDEAKIAGPARREERRAGKG